MSEMGRNFENLVADFCARKWGHERVRQNRFFDDREVDIIVEDGKNTILIECTIDRSKKKAEDDTAKIREIRRKRQEFSRDEIISGLLITPHEPSPDIHKVTEENGSWIKATSLPAFIARYFASDAYLNERVRRPFGSVRSPIDDSHQLERNKYVAVPFQTRDRQTITLDKLVSDIIAGNRTRLVLTGDFGIGKSMTFRELFYRLSDKFFSGELSRFPLYINLRDSTFDEHDDAVDIIERHAKWVGLRSRRDELVQAWTANSVILILDGFDEIVRSGFTGLTTSSRDIRYASSHIIREFVKHSPKTTPIFICGRESYFTTDREMTECLGTDNFAHASLHDLQEKEVRELYNKLFPKHSRQFFAFEWLPQRPLLLAYLYFKLTQDNGAAGPQEAFSATTPGEGWDILLDRLCARETEVARGATPHQIRRLLERVALYGRTNIQESGHVTSLHVAQAYREVFEAEPDLSVQQVLMRLPGLTAGRADEVRRFIDHSFFEAAQAGTVAEIVAALSARSSGIAVIEQYRPLFEQLNRTMSAISPLTAQIALYILKKQGTLGALTTATNEANQHHRGNLTADLLICELNNIDTKTQRAARNIALKDCQISYLEITAENINQKNIYIEDSIIEELEIALAEDSIPRLSFRNVSVRHLRCSATTEASLRIAGLSDVESITHFDATNNDILNSDLPKIVKALKITLKKLFRQAGAGRLRSSFMRGIGTIEPDAIEECLAILLKENIVTFMGLGKAENSIFMPNRAHTRRINHILDTPGIPSDPIIITLLQRWPES